MTRPDPTHRDESPTPPPDQPATPLTSPNGTAHQADALDRFWDDLSRSAVAALPDAPADLAPERAATVAQVHSLATIQIPMGARSRVWQVTLARANGATHRQEHQPMRTAQTVSDGPSAVAVPPPIPERRTRRTSRGWWPRVEVAVAAVLIVGLLTTLLSPSGQQRLGLFGDDNSEQQRDISFSGGATIIEVPESDNGHTLALYELTLEPGASVELPPSDWTIRPVDSSIELTRVFAGDERTEVVNADSVTGSDASTNNRLRNYLDEPVVVWLIAFAGDTPPTIPTAAGTSVEVLATLELTGLESGTFVELTTITRPGEAEPAGIAPREQPGLHLIHVPGSQTGGIVYTARGEVEVANVGDFPNGGPVVVPAGESVTFLEGNHATVRGLSAPTQDEAYPDVYLAVTVRPVAAAENATPQVASLTMDVPADAPLQLVLRRIELQPGTEWGYDFEGSVLIWVESGFATVQFDDHRMEQLFPGRAEFPPVFAQSGSGELRLGTGGDGNEPTVLYQLLAFTEPDINVAMGVAPGTYSSVGRFDSENLHYISDVQLPPGQAEISLSYSQITGSHPFGNGSDLSIVSVTDGSGYVSTGTSEVILSRTEPISGVGGNSTVGVYEPIIGHHDLSTGMTVTGMPGSLFSVGTQSDQPISVIVANVTPFEGPLEGPATPAVATPAAATPASGTPPVYEAGLDDLGEPGCDVAPRTPDELVRLLEEGQANPVDPISLSLRDQAGTGTWADRETALAVTAVFRELAACESGGDELRTYSLYSDEGLRAVLPRLDLDAEYVAGLPELSPTPDLMLGRRPTQALISHIEIFPDGRVGARVGLDGEYAYITFSRQPDGGWLIDVFDDREIEASPGASATPIAATPAAATPATPVSETAVAGSQVPVEIALDVGTEQHVQLVVRRVTLSPGAVWTYDFSGTALWWIETDSVTVSLGDNPPVTIDADGETRSVAMSGTGPITMHMAETSGLAVVYQVLVFTDLTLEQAVGAGTFPEGGQISIENFAYLENVTLPEGPLAIRLDLGELPPAHGLTPGDGTSLTTLLDGSASAWVESGSATFFPMAVNPDPQTYLGNITAFSDGIEAVGQISLIPGTTIYQPTGSEQHLTNAGQQHARYLRVEIGTPGSPSAASTPVPVVTPISTATAEPTRTPTPGATGGDTQSTPTPQVAVVTVDALRPIEGVSGYVYVPPTDSGWEILVARVEMEPNVAWDLGFVGLRMLVLNGGVALFDESGTQRMDGTLVSGDSALWEGPLTLVTENEPAELLIAYIRPGYSPTAPAGVTIDPLYDREFSLAGESDGIGSQIYLGVFADTVVPGGVTVPLRGDVPAFDPRQRSSDAVTDEIAVVRPMDRPIGVGTTRLTTTGVEGVTPQIVQLGETGVIQDPEAIEIHPSGQDPVRVLVGVVSVVQGSLPDTRIGVPMTPATPNATPEAATPTARVPAGMPSPGAIAGEGSAIAMTPTPEATSTPVVEAFGEATLPVPTSANGHSILAAEVTISAGQEWTIPNAAAQIVVLGGAVTVQTDAEGSRAETFAASETTTIEGNLTLQARNTDARFLMLVIVGDGSWIGHPPNDITTTPILLYNGIRLESGEMARLAIGQLLVTEYGIVEPPSRATSTTPAAATGTPASVPLPSQIVVDIHVVEGEAQIGQRVVRASDPSPSVTYSVQLDEQTVQQGMDVLQIRATSDQPAVVWYVTIQVSGNAPLTG